MAATLYVAGNFDDEGGSPSKLANVIFDAISPPNVTYLNGGNFSSLEEICNGIQDFNLIYWFANISNDKPKLVRDIKKRNKACVLVTSKRNVDERYSFHELLFHALENKSNLFVELKRKGERYVGRIIDPLGNVFLDYNEDFGIIGRVLGTRANEIACYTRISSESIKEKIEVPDVTDFFQAIREYAATFHELVHISPESTSRFLGNASFRMNGQAYISRRNIDKRLIDATGFVAVEPNLPVRYFGEVKPSVDTPVQLALYSYYSNISFMLHSHVYIENAPFTGRVIPCGALEESSEIIKLFPDAQNVNFFVNILGHGSLALVNGVGNLRGIPYTERKIPELHLK